MFVIIHVTTITEINQNVNKKIQGSAIKFRSVFSGGGAIIDAE